MTLDIWFVGSEVGLKTSSLDRKDFSNVNEEKKTGLFPSSLDAGCSLGPSSLNASCTVSLQLSKQLLPQYSIFNWP